jgi:hypothetical protein
MSGGGYAPTGPIDEMPAGPYADYSVREEALSHALRGVEMGGYDELIKGWLLRHLDNPTMRTLVSLIERARGAGMVDTLALAERMEQAAERRQAQRREANR